MKIWNNYNARTTSFNLLPTTSNAEGVQIDCHPADDTAEFCDRNFFSRSVTSLVIFLQTLFWYYPAVQLMLVVCFCTLWIWGASKEKQSSGVKSGDLCVRFIGPVDQFNV